MRKLKLGVAGSILLMAFGSLYAAEPAGKILVMQGMASATRAGKDVPLQRGSAVESGDIVRVGDASSLQIRFADESIVALRANTVFGVENFKFAAQEKTGSSIFNLVKGGMRTITGLIGKSNPENFAVKNTNATIGIRGTHFTAVSCAGDCFNADGSRAEDGLFGSVTNGRIVVKTNVGEAEFSRDQFFFAQVNVLPQPLLVPPAFLRDKLDGQAKTKGSTQAIGAASGNTAGTAQAPASMPTMSAAPSTVIGLVTEPTFSVTSTPQAQAVASGTSVAGGATFSWSEAYAGLESYSYSGPGGPSSGTSQYADGYQWEGAPGVFVDDGNVNLTQYGVSTIKDFYLQPFSGTLTWTDDSTGISYTDTYTKTASVDVGSSSAGNVSWGRYSESGTTTGSDGGVDSWSGVYHWAVGDPVTAAPTSGIFTYVPVGGTTPTDHLGNAGTMLNRGTWTVDFGGKTIGTAQSISWSMPNGASYTVAVPMQAFQVQSYSDPAIGTVKTLFAGTNGSLTTSTSCVYPCLSATSTVGVAGFGAQAEGMGASVTATGQMNVGGQQVSGMVNVYKR